MPAIARDGDEFSTGHGCTTTSTLIGQTGESSKVYVNSLAVVCVGDSSEEHTIGNPPVCIPHTATVSVGSSTVYVGGKGIAREGDSIDAGSISPISGNVFAG